MSTGDSSQASAKRKPRRFQFSIAGLLLLTLVVSLGLWYWYRPQEAEVIITSQSRSPPPAHLDSWTDAGECGTVLKDPFVYCPAGIDPFVAATLGQLGYYRREVRSVRRKGFSGVVREGPALVYNRAGRKIFEETWHNDHLDGPYKMWNGDGQFLVSGEFRHGKKYGNWGFWSDDGRNRAGGKIFEETWHNDCLDGPYKMWNGDGQLLVSGEFCRGKKCGRWTFWGADGRKLREQRFNEEGETVKRAWYCYQGAPPSVCAWNAAYRDGKLVQVNGEPVNEFTERLATARESVQDGAFDWRTQPALENVTLHEFVESLGVRSFDDAPIRIMNRALERNGFDLGQRFSTPVADVPLRIGLAATLRKLDLVLDYRFGQLVVTTKEDAETWIDRTGIDQLHPPEGSPWHGLLDRRIGAEPLRASDLPEYTSQLLKYQDGGARIELDPRLLPAAPSGVVGIGVPCMPFRFWLHEVLDREDLTCELQGDTLFIKPLEN